MLEITILLALSPGGWSGAARADDAAGYVPGTGDVLQAEVYAGGTRQEAFTASVSERQTITCPLVGEVAVGGLTMREIVARLTQTYARGYYVNPQVLVNVSQYAGRVTVVGEVKHPGLYPLGAGLTVMSALELAGGLTDFASLHHVHISRAQGAARGPFEVDIVRIRRGRAPDVALQRDDRVEIPQRWF